MLFGDGNAGLINVGVIFRIRILSSISGTSATGCCTSKLPIHKRSDMEEGMIVGVEASSVGTIVLVKLSKIDVRLFRLSADSCAAIAFTDAVACNRIWLKLVLI